MNGRNRTPGRTVFPLLLTLALGIAVASGSQTLAAERLSVDIGESAKLVEDGQAVELKVKVRCSTTEFEVLESFAYVVQDGSQSDFAFFTPVCGVNPAVQVFKVRVPALDFTFQSGEATATAFILLVDPETQETTQFEDQTTIHIK